MVLSLTHHDLGRFLEKHMAQLLLPGIPRDLTELLEMSVIP